MDKNTYETYEYLPVNNSETGNFFIVQDDAQFLVNRQVQYVTQTPDSKPVLDNVVYDVAPQQFLVDVENPPELISVSDQFILPGGENNLYTSGYLIQPETIARTEQVEQDVNEYKHSEEILNIGVVAESNKQVNNSCTEITLNDEQYQMLEQKGWILLEINDKIYLLDTLGLHDITTNDKLIQKLRTESQNNLNQDVNIGVMKTENELHSVENVYLPKDTSNLMTTIEVLPESKNIDLPFEVHKEESEGSVVYNEQKIETTDTNVNYGELKHDEVSLKSEEIVNNVNGTRVLVIDNDDIRREGSTLKVKTRLSLKNFPDKIVLGRTVNGKRLVARVVKPSDKKKCVQLNERNPNNKDSAELQKMNDRKWEIEKNIPAIHLGNLLTEGEFLALIRHLLKTNSMNKCSAEDVVAADNVITQLLQLPAFEVAVMDSHLVVTKTVQNEDASGQTFNKGLKAVVTGKVTLIDGGWHFVHLPYMLQNMINASEEHFKNAKPIDTNKNIFDVLHVQISESKQAGTNIIKASVTVNKRMIPMTIMSNTQKFQTNTVYACSGCASLFYTEEVLKQHQLSDCLEPKLLTADVKSSNTINNDYSIVNGPSKTYVCKTCNVKFSRLSTIKNHIKTHVPEVQEAGDTTQTANNQSNGVYKCSMCPCSYFHPSTLSKHILSTHIKIKS